MYLCIQACVQMKARSASAGLPKIPGRVRRVWTAYDSNGEGFVKTQDLRFMLQDLNIQYTRNALAVWLRGCGAENGKIPVDGFMQYIIYNRQRGIDGRKRVTLQQPEVGRTRQPTRNPLPGISMRRNREPCHGPGERCGGTPFKKHYQRIANNYPSWFSLLEGRPLPSQGAYRE
jgi:hypothetical protein